MINLTAYAERAISRIRWPAPRPPLFSFEQDQHYRCADYLNPALRPSLRPKLIDCLVKLIEKSGIKFDTIAFRGMSGALVAPALADRMRKHLIMVRHGGDSHTHSSYAVEGNLRRGAEYIIVDDLIDTGKTADTILDEIEHWDCDAKCVGIFLYRGLGRGHHRGIPVFKVYVGENDPED